MAKHDEWFLGAPHEDVVAATDLYERLSKACADAQVTSRLVTMAATVLLAHSIADGFTGPDEQLDEIWATVKDLVQVARTEREREKAGKKVSDA